MATRYSDIYTGLTAAPVKKFATATIEKPVYATYAQTTTNVATSDVLVLDKLPAGYILVAGNIFFSADPATTAYNFSVGLYTDVPAAPVVVDVDAYISATDKAGANGAFCAPVFDTPTTTTGVACNRAAAAADQLICITYGTVTAPLACTITFVGIAIKVL